MERLEPKVKLQHFDVGPFQSMGELSAPIAVNFQNTETCFGLGNCERQFVSHFPMKAYECCICYDKLWMPDTEISLHPRCANALTAMQFLCIPKIYIILRISDPQLPNEPLTFCEAKILFPFPVLVPLLWSKISLGRTWLRTWQVTFALWPFWFTVSDLPFHYFWCIHWYRSENLCVSPTHLCRLGAGWTVLGTVSMVCSYRFRLSGPPLSEYSNPSFSD